jgi:hypothetical protein
MKKRRRLGDLYVRGKEVSVNDGTGDPVLIWLQKLSEVERDAVFRRATAAKTRYMLESQHEESELFASVLGSVLDYIDRDGRVSIIIGEELAKARERVEEQLTADEDGWGKDDKIKGLIDAWAGTDDEPGLAATYAEDEADPEALRVKAELDAFEVAVEAGVDQERQRLERDWSDAPDNDLARFATREVLKRRADETFMREYMRQQVFYCVRDLEDHHSRYFGTVGEVDDLDDRIRQFLEQQCVALTVSLMEGKDSPASPASSNSSEPTSEVEVSEDSGLAIVTA